VILSELKVSWNQISRISWDKFYKRNSNSFQQDWIYGLSLESLGIECHRAEIFYQGNTVAIAQFICRNYFKIFNFALCSKGPIWENSLPSELRIQIFNELKKNIPLNKPKFVFFSPALKDSADPSLKSLSKVMTGQSTALVSLIQSEEKLRSNMESKWRNRLVSAEQAGIRILQNSLKPSQFSWLLDEEKKLRKNRGFYGLPTEFVTSYIKFKNLFNESTLLIRAELKKDKVAAMLFLLHGKSATYHLGWTNELGRNLNAHNLILWKSFLELKNMGIEKLDLGGINTRSLPGISRFKIGSGGKVITYPGIFI